jgi:hypothetical protein
VAANPTAENIAIHIYMKLERLLKAYKLGIRVWESPGCMVEVG